MICQWFNICTIGMFRLDSTGNTSFANVGAIGNGQVFASGIIGRPLKLLRNKYKGKWFLKILVKRLKKSVLSVVYVNINLLPQS